MIEDDLLSRTQECGQRKERPDPDPSRPDPTGPGARFARPRSSAMVACHSATIKGSTMLLLLATLAAAFAVLLIVALN